MALRLSLCCIAALLSTEVRAELIWHWEDQFSEAEQQRLKAWIRETVSGVERLVRPYPFDVHIHFKRTSGRRGPVPWANTIRGRRQGVNFNVDARSSAAELRADWTASHELSHLLLPYLGRRHSWFAEGFASFMQYRVMRALGVISDEQAESRYRERIGRAERRYDLDDTPFVDAASELRSRRQYSTMYWGGAVYFLNVDRALGETGTSVVETIGRFVDCCRATTRGLNDLIEELDRLSGGSAFKDELRRVRSEPGFPDTSMLWAGGAAGR